MVAKGSTMTNVRGWVAITTLALTACGTFQEGTPLDAQVASDSAAHDDGGTSLDMASLVDMASPVDMTSPVDGTTADASVRMCRDDGLGPALSFASTDATAGCCKVRLVYDSDAPSLVFPRSETPLAPDPMDLSAYVRIATPGGSLCHSYSVVGPHGAPNIDYEMPDEARLYSASFSSSGGSRSECVNVPSPFGPRSGTAITIGTQSECSADSCNATTRWVATGVELSFEPPDDCEGFECAMLDPRYLLIGWKPWSGAPTACAASDPSFGDTPGACPADGTDGAVLDEIPDCPAE